MKLLRYSSPFTNKREVFEALEKLQKEYARLDAMYWRRQNDIDRLHKILEDLEQKLYERTGVESITATMLSKTQYESFRIDGEVFGMQLRLPSAEYCRTDELVLNERELDMVSQKFAHIVHDHISHQIRKNFGLTSPDQGETSPGFHHQD